MGIRSLSQAGNSWCRWGGCGLGSVWEERVRRFTCRLCVPSLALSCNENDAEHLDRDQPYPSSQKTKRMRTSFKHHQLRTMKSYFAINHNPDAKDLKQLAQKTGLTKRVLQVRLPPGEPRLCPVRPRFAPALARELGLPLLAAAGIAASMSGGDDAQRGGAEVSQGGLPTPGRCPKREQDL